MTVGADRNEAIARMSRALDEVVVTGVQTTLPFHRTLLASVPFRDAALSTDHVDQHWDGAAERARYAERAAKAAATRAHVAPATAPSLRTDSPDGWRARGRADATDRWPR
jgi:acetyl/propionyl-CoA carboxylase alpha subunit